MIKSPTFSRLLFFLPIIVAFFISSTALKAADAKEYNWFWFLYEQDQVSHYPSTLITPFYFHSRIKKNEEYTASLPPVLFWKYATDHSVSRNWFFGFAGDVDYTHPNGVEDYDLGVLPFLLYGNSPDKKDQYLFIWPIGGTFKGKIGMDYISPWIFPGVLLFFLYPPQSLLYLPAYIVAAIIPVYVSYGKDDYSAHGIFWPMIQWGRSHNRTDFRILPFYAHNTKKDYYDNHSWLMLINYDREFMPHGREVDTFMFTPFFARKWDSFHISGASALLWPFFSWGYNKKQGDFEINFPWPFFIYERSEKPFIRKKVFFPFYGDIVYNREETTFITPLYFRMTSDNDIVSSSYMYVGIIAWYFTRTYKKEPSDYYGNEWRYFKIWPIVRYESNDKGDMHFNILSVLPFRDPAGYDKIYDPLFSLVEFHRENGVRRFGLLLRTYYQCWDDRSFQARIPFLFRYGSFDGKMTELTFLFSMFGYERNSEGEFFRFFWYPFRIGDEISQDNLAGGEELLPSESIPPYSEKIAYNQILFGKVNF